MRLHRLRRPPAGDDRGVAIMTTIMIGAVLTATAVFLVDVSTSNLRNAGRDRVAGGAYGAAEAGIAQAVAYMRLRGVGDLSCSPGCTANPWGSSTSPQELSFSDGRTARVWIEKIEPFNPPAVRHGTYKVHSEGSSGQGPGLRRLEQTVRVDPFRFPMGVYAQRIELNGSPKTFQQSLFSDSCILGREKMTFEGIDSYYGIPAGAHSAQYIREGNSGVCGGGNTKNIHSTGVCPAKTEYWNDQDLEGNVLDGTSCYSSSNPVRTTSHFNAVELAKYGLKVPASVLAALRAKAQSMGQYWESGQWTPPDPTVHPDAVIYFKVSAGDTINIANELDGYNVNPDTCTPRRSVIVIVDNESVGAGGLQLQSNANLMGALLVPNGEFAYRGMSTFTGPINANTIKFWNGTSKSKLTDCYVDNMPGGLLDLRLTRFHEVDR